MSNSTNHTAPGQAAGYLFQPERALYLLATSERGSKVGIETEDDVVRLSKNETIREQDKHTISPSGYPLSDRSKDLWNTLKIWLNTIEAGEVDLKNTQFFIVTNKVLPSDFLVKCIGESEDDVSAEKCLGRIRDAGQDPPEGLRTIFDYVLTRDDTLIRNLIKKISVFDGSDSTHGFELRELIISHLHIPSHLPSEIILNSLLGWVHDTVLDQWRSGKPAWLTREAFDNYFWEVTFNVQSRSFVETAKKLLPVDSKECDAHRHRIFVRQLSILKIVDDMIIDAIEDYIRCSNERTRLSHEGYITKEDFSAFDQRLLDRWKTIFLRNKLRFERDHEPAENVGFDILLNTIEHREYLAGRQTQEFYLTRGSYHKLADFLEVGWHPTFRTILGGEEE